MTQPARLSTPMNRPIRQRRDASHGTSALLWATLLALGLGAGCGDERDPQPPSLDAPTAIDQATRPACGEASPTLGSFSESDGTCAIGLVANADNNRVAVTDLNRRRPVLRDLDPTVPGLTHIKVGPRPIDLAASADGTTAYTLNALDNTLTILDLWRLEPLQQTLSVPGTPVGLETGADSIAVALQGPDQIWIRPGVTCSEPDDPSTSDCEGLEAEAETRPLAGHPSDLTIGAEGRAFVSYHDRNFLSVFALSDDQLGDGAACRGARTEAPCEIDRVGLTWSCSDGIDNDGDGRADQQDPQCYGPKGSETPGGVGRKATGACADGVDNDGDGEVDRDDEACQLSVDDSESEPFDDSAVFACSDGRDNDGDGLADYPDDPDCYGPTGQRESLDIPTGFSGLATDGKGTMLYLVDTSQDQLLTVDTTRMELVDAGRATEPEGAPFTDRLGVGVPSRAAVADGIVSRSIRWEDPDDPAHGIIRHQYGAYVASDNGQVYFVETVSADCEVRETDRESLLTNKEFQRGGEAFQNSREKSCLTFPDFDASDDPMTDACAAVASCRSCLADNPAVNCTDECAEFESNRRQCRVAGRELSPADGVRVAANPIFDLQDRDSRSGRLRGTGTCNEPPTYIESLRAFVADNPDAPRVFGCESSLRPQPVSRFATEEDLDRPNFGELDRADLLQRTSLRLSPPGGEADEVQAEPVDQSYDSRYRNETWTVAWEGVLPGTDRNDGLFDQEEAGALDTDGLNLCRAGVRAGDRVVVETEPSGEDGCGDFTPPEESDGEEEGPGLDDDPFLTYRVAEVGVRSLQLEPIPAREGDFSQTLPTRECFPTAIDYEIRTEDRWTVYGSESGLTSARTSELGACVPRFGAETGEVAGSDSDQLGGRVNSGGVFTGPYLDFRLFQGSVPPVRRQDDPFAFSFAVQRFFSATFPTSNSSSSGFLQSGSLLPSDIMVADSVDGGVKILLTDASSDFIWVRNLTFRTGDDVLRLR